MPLVLIPVSFMIVMPVVPVFLVGVLPVSIMFVVITTFSITLVTVTTAIITFFLVLMVLGVLLFVSPPLSRFVFPIIGQGNTRTAKDYNDKKAKQARDFHDFPPKEHKRVTITANILQAGENRQFHLLRGYLRFLKNSHESVSLPTIASSTPTEADLLCQTSRCNGLKVSGALLISLAWRL